ncbi:leucine-rich repeat domain-containing protein [Psychrobacter okhotskensis]|uniref:leucine-rich repeat domain-containing protein n=1 Tax=Psychrobacter okhotskensis TaxID=212403 RepID=UPI00191AD1D0|nr:leucine-rich repeat domain-containing protein [Psychrobacter okhotskensis]
MKTSNTTTAKPWMSELWTWADEYGISEKDLPRNEAHLLAITKLEICSDQITELPEGIGYLHNLTHLTLKCEALERLPESIGQLSQLERLTITSDEVKQLPESFARLISLSSLNIPTHLSNQLPTTLMDKCRNENETLHIERMAFTSLYSPLEKNYGLSFFGFVLISDDWNEKALIDLKFKAVLDFLLVLQTTEQTIDDFDVVDGVIICKPDEVQKIINMFETTFDYSVVSVDFRDVREAINFAKPAKFIQASALKVSESDKVFSQIIDQIPEDITINAIMFQAESNRQLTLDELRIASDTIDKMDIDDKYVFYNAEVVDKPEHCWMGMIYMIG